MALGIKYPDDSLILSLVEESDILSSTVLAMLGNQPAKVSGSALRGGPQGIQIALRSYYGTGAGQIITFTPAITPRAIFAVRANGDMSFWCEDLPPTMDLILNAGGLSQQQTDVFDEISAGSITFGTNTRLCFPADFFSMVILGE
jgi:hypothetical protein